MKNKLNYRFDFAHRCTAENCAYCQNGNCYSVYYNAHFQNQCNTFLKKGKTGYASEFAIRMMNAGFRFMVSDHYIDGRILSGDLDHPRAARLVLDHGRTFTAVLCNENGTDSDHYFNISNVEALRGYFMTIEKFKKDKTIKSMKAKDDMIDNCNADEDKTPYDCDNADDNEKLTRPLTSDFAAWRQVLLSERSHFDNYNSQKNSNTDFITEKLNITLNLPIEEC